MSKSCIITGGSGLVGSNFKDGIKINETLSDDFGDFKFDFLEPNSGKYSVNINYNENYVSMLNETKQLIVSTR